MAPIIQKEQVSNKVAKKRDRDKTEGKDKAGDQAKPPQSFE